MLSDVTWRRLVVVLSFTCFDRLMRVYLITLITTNLLSPRVFQTRSRILSKADEIRRLQIYFVIAPRKATQSENSLYKNMIISQGLGQS